MSNTSVAKSFVVVTESGEVMGAYDGTSEAEALDAYARDAGYSSYTDIPVEVGGSASALEITTEVVKADEDLQEAEVDVTVGEVTGRVHLWLGGSWRPADTDLEQCVDYSLVKAGVHHEAVEAATEAVIEFCG